MRRRWVIALLPVLLAGCQRGPSTGAAHASLPVDGGSIEWQGRRACADCRGIATRLVLAQGDDRREYELTETFFTEGGDTRFAEHGRWRRQAALLQLQGDTGSRRAFALLPDGRLQPSDGHGEPLSLDEDALLVPVAGTGP
jgi:hypothetical protein